MSKYLIDTNVLIDILRGKCNFEKVSKFENPSISVITLSELYYGAEKSKSAEKSIAWIDRLVEQLNLKVLSYDYETSKVFANIKANLEKNGEKLEDFDLMIASTAICNNQILITGNIKHFGRVESLRIINSK